jgi:two-component system, chemotaxis family, CheB/CheR fusion protein
MAEDEETVRAREGLVRQLVPAHDLAGISVLLIEDDYETRAATDELLRAAGALVRSVTSVPEALNLFRAVRFHVILADLGLPDMDGYALIRALRRQQVSIPVIAYTGRNSREDAIYVRHAGFTLHLTKPVPPVDIVAAVALAASGRAHEFVSSQQSSDEHGA